MRIYFAQKKHDPLKGDWVNQVKEDLKNVGSKTDNMEISPMKKSLLTRGIKRIVRAATFNSLKTCQQTHKDKGQLQKYFNIDYFSTDERSTLLNI